MFVAVERNFLGLIKTASGYRLSRDFFWILLISILFICRINLFRPIYAQIILRDRSIIFKTISVKFEVIEKSYGFYTKNNKKII